jgi:hypothetical protein
MFELQHILHRHTLHNFIEKLMCLIGKDRKFVEWRKYFTFKKKSNYSLFSSIHSNPLSKTNTPLHMHTFQRSDNVFVMYQMHVKKSFIALYNFSRNSKSVVLQIEHL